MTFQVRYVHPQGSPCVLGFAALEVAEDYAEKVSEDLKVHVSVHNEDSSDVISEYWP